MISFVAFMLAGIAVAYGQTNGAVRTCMQTAHANCKTRCLPSITNEAVRGKVSTCFSQAEADNQQKAATVQACLNAAVTGFDNLPCFTKPSFGNGNGGGHSGQKFGQADSLSAFHNCTRTCANTEMTACTSSCTATMTTAVQTALRTCKPQWGGRGRPATSTGTFDMRTCMRNAVSGTA